MSATLESALDAERIREARRNDIAAGIDPVIGATLSPFIEAAITARRSAYISALRRHKWQLQGDDDANRMHAMLLIERAHTDPDGMLWNTYCPAEFQVRA